MQKSKWVDGVRSDKVISSELRINKVVIQVHRHVSSSPDIWWLSCENVFISMKRLESRDIELAKLQAVQIVSVNLERVVEGLAVESGISEDQMGVFVGRENE